MQPHCQQRPVGRRAWWARAALCCTALLYLPVTAAPERPYSPAVAARFPAPSVHYTTPAFQNGRDTFTGHEELAAFMAALAAQPGGPQRLVLGRSQQGQAIEAWRFASGSARPERPERPVVLLIGQQHGDEPAGSEALLALAQQLMPPAPPAPADKKPHSTSLAPLLQHIDVIVLPRANPDGAEYGQRLAMDGQDINRDHLLLRTPEARALAQLVRDFSPVVVVDSHEHTVVGRYLEKFKAVQRFDLLLQYAMTANLPLELGRASEDWFRQPLLQALAAEELTSEWYYTNPTTPGDLRLSMGGAQPDTARNVNGLKNAISILLETRGVGIGRLHFERRVHTQVVALRSLLASAAQRAGELGALQRRVQDQISASACLGQVVVLAAQTPLTREVLMLDPVSGADVPVAVQWQSSLELRPLVQRPRPCGYWLEETASDSVLRLQALVCACSA